MRKSARKKAIPNKVELTTSASDKNKPEAKTAGTVKNQFRQTNPRVDTVAFALKRVRARSGEQSGDLQESSNVPSAKTPSALVPAVDPADLKRIWAMQNDFQARNPGQENAIGIDHYKHACSPGADVGAVLSRLSMLGMVQNVAEAGHLTFPWIHYGTPEEVVFKIVATIPMVRLQPGVRHGGFPFDVEELIRQIKNESEE